MTTRYHLSEWMLKRTAKRVSRVCDKSHTQVLNELAIMMKFRDWADLKQRGQYVETEEVNEQDFLNRFEEAAFLS